MADNIWAAAQQTLKPKSPEQDPDTCKSSPTSPDQPEVRLPPVLPGSQPDPPVKVQATAVLDMNSADPATMHLVVPVLRWSCLQEHIKTASCITFNSRIQEHMKYNPMIKNWIWTAVSIACQQPNIIQMPFPVPDDFCEALGVDPGSFLYVVRKADGIFSVIS